MKKSQFIMHATRFCIDLMHYNILVQKLHLLGIKAQGVLLQFLILPEKANHEVASTSLYVYIRDSDF